MKEEVRRLLVDLRVRAENSRRNQAAHKAQGEHFLESERCRVRAEAYEHAILIVRSHLEGAS